MRKERKMKGFTLVELLIVLLILGILIGLAVPRYLAALDKSKETTFCSNVRNVVSAIETWRMNEGTTAYPGTASALNEWIITSTTYFSQIPVNPYKDNATLTATEATTSSNTKGYFYYKGASDSYEIQTNPPCGLQ